MSHLYLIDDLFYSSQEEYFEVDFERDTFLIDSSESDSFSNINVHSTDSLLTIRKTTKQKNKITCIGLRRKNEGDINDFLPKNNLLEAVASLFFF